jgi:hypothetical protein
MPAAMSSLPDDARPGVAAKALEAVPDAATLAWSGRASGPAKADAAAAATQAPPVAAKNASCRIRR